ncbi:unnamed protein product [Toxocara canis]|uniref:Wzz domain-containing protein n=1 Tax=Toxocara canis TaxID=6265 RepID=A0A183V9P9_TOXCA|nr:unnamed protein product [Toxocara canis]
MIHPDPDTQSCPTTSAWPDRKISSKAALVHQTLAYDYPAIDYLGIRDIIRAKHKWFKILWFAIVFILLASSLFTVYRIIREYIEKPTAINLSVKSVEQMLLPQVTVCPTTPMTVNVTLLAQTMRAQPQFNAITDQTVLDFAEFMIAGSGFQKMDAFVQKWDIQYINYLTSIYDTMRQSVDTRTFFYKIKLEAMNE